MATPADPGLDAARTRVAALLEELTRVDLQVVVVSALDATRSEARATARSAAVAAGRGGLMEDAVAAAREVTFRSFANSGFSGTWAVTDMAMSVTRAEDRVAAAAAFEEAAMAAVVEDLVDDETTDILRSTTDGLIDMTGVPVPGSLSSFAAPPSGSVRGPLQVAALIAYAVLCVVIAVMVGLGFGLLLLALGVAIVAGLSRQRRTSEP